MLAIHIQAINDFMQKLLTPGVFDTFELVKCTIKTYAVFSIDGSFQSAWADNMSNEASPQAPDNASFDTPLNHPRYSQWKEFVSPVRSIISGRKKPALVQIVFRLADYNTSKIIDHIGHSFSLHDIDGLYLNITYTYNGNDETVLCTTGTSMRTFTFDKTVEHTWDDMVRKLFHAKQIPFLE